MSLVLKLCCHKGLTLRRRSIYIEATQRALKYGFSSGYIDFIPLFSETCENRTAFTTASSQKREVSSRVYILQNDRRGTPIDGGAQTRKAPCDEVARRRQLHSTEFRPHSGSLLQMNKNCNCHKVEIKLNVSFNMCPNLCVRCILSCII